MKKAMLLFIDIMGAGGIQEYNKCLCDALCATFPMTMFTGRSLNDISDIVINKRWPGINITGYGNIRPGWMAKLSFTINSVFTALSERPDFLICTHVNLAPIAFLLKKLSGLKYSVATHGVDCWDLKSGIRYSALREADIVTTVSRYSRDRMVANGISAGKIKILVNSINVSRFSEDKTVTRPVQRLETQGRNIILTVGRVSGRERYKGHDIMLKVLERLDSKYMWLVAGDGDDMPRLKKKAQESGLIDRVKFLGGVDEKTLVECYNLCDVFVMPSKGEGFGRVFLEAMACGKPVIGGNKDGSNEPLMDGKLGFLVDPDNVDEIAAAIETACTVKEDRTNPSYLASGVEKNFGIAVFNERAKNIFAPVLL